MKDEHKHNIASAIYNGIIAFKRELRFIWKQLLLGIIIAIICAFLNDYFGGYDKALWTFLGVLGFIPMLYKYYKRLKNWVLKWK